ncbi:chemotaxis protein CheW [Phenylobacterium sp.]|uniref:chemotaxis protein CheW n=1 Tax=Phenylobacterium sp. TaxID=1871053 RepID=UPI002F3FAF6B
MTNASETDMRELISFQVSGQRYCVDIMDVREIRGWTQATPLPHAPDFMHGVINLRGAVLPIIDLAARFRLGPSTPTARHVVIVVSIEGKLVGLLVDAVCDILTVSEAQMQATPDMMGQDVQEFVEALLTVEERMIGLVRLPAIMPPAESIAA